MLRGIIGLEIRQLIPRRMSQPTRDIASYFHKPSPVTSPSSPKITRAGPSSPKGSPLQASAISTTTTALDTPEKSAASRAGATATPPSTAGVKRSLLSDAARQAIMNGAGAAEDEHANKKAKTDSGAPPGETCCTGRRMAES